TSGGSTRAEHPGDLLSERMLAGTGRVLSHADDGVSESESRCGARGGSNRSTGWPHIEAIDVAKTISQHIRLDTGTGRKTEVLGGGSTRVESREDSVRNVRAGANDPRVEKEALRLLKPKGDAYDNVAGLNILLLLAGAAAG